MFPNPLPALVANTFEYESLPMVKPTGFRQYDARWFFGEELNLGMGLATLIRRMGVKPEIVTGHDFRGYSSSIKMALVTGLRARLSIGEPIAVGLAHRRS